MTRSSPNKYADYGLTPSHGFHLLKDKWNQRSYIGEHSRALLSGLDDAITATKTAAQRRIDPAHHFRIERGRANFHSRGDTASERGLEQQLFQEFGPHAPRRDTPLWAQLVAYQVPLFASRTMRDSWGSVDLLAVTADFDPVVIELKRGDATDTPLRTLLECVANMIAVEANWARIRAEISTLQCVDGLRRNTAQTVAVPHGILLAPKSYWTNWDHGGAFAHRADARTRAAFKELRSALSDKGYATSCASVGLNDGGQPEVCQVECDW